MRSILLIIGFLLIALSIIMAATGAIALLLKDSNASVFLLSAAVSFAAGCLLWLLNHRVQVSIRGREVFLLTTLTWLSIALFSALPLQLVDHLSFADALFETISGITTTGSTILVDLESEPVSVLLWRSVLQWIGGLGFVVVGVALLPFIGVGGMRLFQSESSDWSEKSLPRTRYLAFALVMIYAALTIACAIAYLVAGMSVFDAANHAMTTVSTGGFSTYDNSLGHYESKSILVVASVFMVLGSLPFALYIQAARGYVVKLFQDEQARGFILFLAMTTLAYTLWLEYWTDGHFVESLVAASFNVISIVTTTGYVSTDYQLWGNFATIGFFYLMFVGGCSGSTAGAIKIFRFQLAFRLFKSNLLHLVHPRGVFPLRYNGKLIESDIIRSLVSFSLAYFALIGVSSLLLALTGLDPITSLSGSITAVSNVGPGLGDVIGPAGNFSSLPDAAKIILSIDMIMGRLEILTVVAVLSPHFWRS